MAAQPNVTQTEVAAPGGINQYLNPVNVNTSPDMFGAPQARAIGQIGESIERVTAVGARIVEQQQEENNRTEITNLSTKAQRDYNAAFTEYSALRGEAAVAGYQPFLERLRTIREEISGVASNPAVRRQLDPQLLQHETSIMAGGARYNNQQVREASLNAQQGVVDVSRNNAVLFRNDEARLTQAAEAAAGAVNRIAEQEGWDGATRQARLAQARGQVYGDAIRAMVDDDPIRAQALYERTRDRMDAASVISIGNAIEGPVRLRQAQNIVQSVVGGGQSARNVIFRAENPAGDARRTGAAASDPTLTASGPGQITDGMWNTYASRLGLQPGQRNQRAAHEAIFDAFQSDMSRQMGRQLSGQEQYAAWFLGSAGFVAFTNAAPNADAREVFTRVAGARAAEQAFRSNGSVMRDGMTVQQVLNQVSGRYNSVAARMGAGDGEGVQRRSRAEMLQEVISRTEHDPRLQQQAISQLNQRLTVMDAANSQQRATTERLVTETQQALETGATVPLATVEQAVRRDMEPVQADRIIDRLRTAEVGGMIANATTLATPERIAEITTDLRDGTGDFTRFLRQQRGTRMMPDGTVHAEDSAGDIATRAEMQRILGATLERRGAQLRGQNSDPAGYVGQMDPTVQQAAAAMQADNTEESRRAYANASRTAQMRLGVPEAETRTLTRSMSASIAQSLIQTSGDEANISRSIDGLRRQWGQEFPAIFRDLVRDGHLPPAYQTAGILTNPSGQAAFQEMLVTARQMGGIDRMRAALVDTTRRDLDNSVEDPNGPTGGFMRTFLATNDPGATALAMRTRDDIRNLASFYALRQGMSGPQAVQLATQRIVDDQYEIEGTLRLPRRQANGNPISMAQVRPALNHVRTSLTGADLAEMPGPPGLSPEQRQERALTSAIRGHWVTNPNDNGAILMRDLDDGRAGPVLRRDGSMVTVTFDSLPEVPSATAPERAIQWRNRGSASGFYSDPIEPPSTSRAPTARAPVAATGGAQPPAAIATPDPTQRPMPGTPGAPRRNTGRWTPEPPR
jgi:hypothetical protein